MDLGISHYDLAPVEDVSGVWAGIIPYNGNNSKHEAVLYEALPRFLGAEFVLHGKPYPMEYLGAVVDAANHKEIEINFPVVAYESCGRVKVFVVGIMTGKRIIHAMCAQNNNLVPVPFWHAEDTSLDPDLARQFREYTASLRRPNGIGLGTHLTKLKMLQLCKDDLELIYGGRENEYDDGNMPIKGVMGKLGASLGTTRNSPVLQLDARLPHLERKGWVDVKTEVMPNVTGHQLYFENLWTPWSSKDGKQQLVVVDSLIRSTVDASWVAWTKIKSNGYVPKGTKLEDILEEMLTTSREKMIDLEWGAPGRQAINGGGYSHKFGCVVPVRRFHMNKESEIAEAMQKHKIKAEPRSFGCKPMMSGLTPNPKEIFGQTLPQATQVKSIDPASDANRPYFDLAPQPNEINAHTLFADGQKGWVEPSRGQNDNRLRSNPQFKAA